MRVAATFVLILAVSSIQPAIAKNRNPRDYPQRAKVLSFSRQQGNGSLTRCDPAGTGVNCLGLGIVHHVLEIQIEGQKYTVSCFHCDPLVPGKTYPARVQLKDMEILIIHQKDNGKWGQDSYKILRMDVK